PRPERPRAPAAQRARHARLLPRPVLAAPRPAGRGGDAADELGADVFRRARAQAERDGAAAVLRAHRVAAVDKEAHFSSNPGLRDWVSAVTRKAAAERDD